jgi:DNA-3-methyladenine glycosylase I
MIEYHDRDWATPLHDDAGLFEFLVLSGTQAGLSWEMVWRKREAYQRAFAGFDPARVATFTARDLKRLLADPGIVRNRQKLEAAIHNAHCVVEAQKEHGSFDAYLWSFVKGATIVNRRRSIRDLPPRTPLSDRISADMKKRGFKFVGTTIVYAYIQSVGLVNDHLISCFRHPSAVRK